MLTVVESLSLAGDRAKQNDDACGALGARAWVIDGATDLHNAPLTGAASDAAWIAFQLNAALMGAGGADLRAGLGHAQRAVAQAFAALAPEGVGEAWKSPIASLVLIGERAEGVEGLDLGDCRCFALDANGAAYDIGGPPKAADRETALAAEAQKRAGGGALLRDEKTIDMLRAMRATQNGHGGSWTFSLNPECVQHARAWTLNLARPAHLLLASDGFAALADRYDAYDASGLVRAALDKGLQELGRELRAIEAGDDAGGRYPRWKKSDDATALLLRLT